MKNKTQYDLRGLMIILLIIEVIFWPVFFSLKVYLENNDPTFRFENPEWLWGLLIIPVYLAFALAYAQWKNKTVSHFAEHHLLSKLTDPVSTFSLGLRIVFIRLSLFCFILAITNPQYGKGTRTAKSEGVDIIVALDISNSMLTKDSGEQWNRLKKAKLDIERMIQQLGGDRLGLIVFAGVPVVQLPVTQDLAASKFFLSGISPEMITVQGTDIGSAIELAQTSFPETDKRQRVLIVVTDGENHEQEAIYSARQAKANNIIVHTVGLGSEKGAPIPVYENDEYKGLKRDKDGNTIISKLNSKLLIDIASAGGGTYVHAGNNVSAMEIIIDEIRKMQQTEIESIDYPEYEDRFQLFVFIAICLLLAETLVPRSWFNFQKISEYGK